MIIACNRIVCDGQAVLKLAAIIPTVEGSVYLQGQVPAWVPIGALMTWLEELAVAGLERAAPIYLDKPQATLCPIKDCGMTARYTA